jgi:hypothetical protein
MSQPVDFASAMDLVRFDLLLTWLVADAPERPRWNQGDFFEKRVEAP